MLRRAFDRKVRQPGYGAVVALAEVVAIVGAAAVVLAAGVGALATLGGSLLAPRLVARADSVRREEERTAIEASRRKAAIRDALKALVAAAAAAAISANGTGIPSGEASLQLAAAQAGLELELLPGEESLANAVGLALLVMNGPLPGSEQGLLVGSITKSLAKWHTGRATLEETVFQLDQTYQLWTRSRQAPTA